MREFLIHILIPMIFSNVIHMVLVKKNVLPTLLIPISKLLFGTNKTWRGVVIVSGLNAFFFWLVNLFNPLFTDTKALLFGAILGFLYILFELPNSFLKRRLGIGSGQAATKNAWLFMLLDKSDSALGVALGSKFLFNFSWLEMLQLFFVGIFVHIFFSWLLVVIGIKKRF